MFDTLTVVAYLLGNEPGHSRQLQMQAQFLNNPAVVCVQSTKSPQIRWHKIPPEADSLALIVKDTKNYYWVVYNLPVQTKGLPLGANQQIQAHDEGINSWGQSNYRSWCAGNIAHPLTVELYALDKRFTATQPMSGLQLEQKMKGHVLAKVVKAESAT
jgi:Raf kinase inhibitor-like YbhB/YbcL family protein